MRCPRCEQRVFGFFTWGGLGSRVFHPVDCPHCGAALRVGRRILVPFVLAIASSIPIVCGLGLLFSWLGLGEPLSTALFGILVLPIVIGITYPVWRLGRYELRQGPEPQDKETRQTPGSSVRRFVIVLAVGLGLTGLMVLGGSRDIVLTFSGEQVIGRVTRVHQPPGGAIRASDFEVEYEFEDASRVTHVGKDVLPPAKPPPEDGRIEIIYLPRDPSISRIASQHNAGALFGVVLGLGIVVSAVVQFMRARRRPSG